MDCSVGTYSNVTATSSCLTCPAFSTSPAASANISECACQVGYTHTVPGTPCTACQPGTYKETNGSAACTPCAAGTYSAVLNASTADTCTLCPGQSWSLNGSSSVNSCWCNEGYTGMVPLCQACVPGTYKVEKGSSACRTCAAGVLIL